MALPREDSKSERNEFEVVSRFRLRVTRGEDLRSFDHASKVNQLRNGVGGLEKEREREKKTIRSLAIVINNLEFVISGNGARGAGAGRGMERRSGSVNGETIEAFSFVLQTNP